MRIGFRQAVRSGQTLVGAFIKTASHQMVEIMGRTGLDFAIVDAEHAPFGPEMLDRMALAAQASDLPLLLRPPSLDAALIGQSLDLGLVGVVAPHVHSAALAEALLDAVKFARGHRGFSPSTRAGGYGAPDASAYRRAADLASSSWCQIEDASALSCLGEIAAIEAIDCLFIGRADLAMSLGVESTLDPKVSEAVRLTVDAGRRAGRTVGIFVSGPQEIPELRALGISVFVSGSDQSWIMAEGRRLRNQMGQIIGEADK